MTVASNAFALAADRANRGFERGHTVPVRAASVFFGFAFIWAGAGLWLVPGLDLEPGVLMVKAFLSIMMVAAGIGMTQIATARKLAEMHFDSRTRQVHLIEMRGRGRRESLRSVGYDAISSARVTDQSLVLLDQRGKAIAEMALEGPDMRDEAIAHLRSQSITLS
ncbi:hypothetical protein NBRC116590_02250 [Pelagimonas sp. KU-00592-HH]|uniref:hypothetical protein n=1 Tax=Pelagimonas sp. KU-00592-HH TaxID=3127651 RepID=UPI003106A197